jgi:hypothetical protein
MIASAAVTFAVVEIFWPTRIPPELRGTWVVVDGAADLKGDTLEIFRTGAMIGRKRGHGATAPDSGTLTSRPRATKAIEPPLIRGRVRLHENSLRITALNPLTDNEVTDVQTILDWSDDKLVLESQQGELLIMQRRP